MKTRINRRGIYCLTDKGIAELYQSMFQAALSVADAHRLIAAGPGYDALAERYLRDALDELRQARGLVAAHDHREAEGC